MNKSLKRDIQLLMNILKNQEEIIEAIKDFGCNASNLDQNKHAFDLCAFYMAQIGEAAKLLTDATKQSFQYFDSSVTSYFRNMIDHVYEKVDKVYLKAYIFSTIDKKARDEVKNRIAYCQENIEK